jgi:hypothetical protein
VLGLQPGRQPAELAVAERGQAAPDPHAVAVRLGQPELHAALEGAGEVDALVEVGLEAQAAGEVVEAGGAAG